MDVQHTDKSKTTLRITWYNMKARCNYKRNVAYEKYGGRGIIVCDEWLNDFKVFYFWAVMNGYKEGLQIDRIDNNGNYEPNNCRFVTSAINNQNRSSTKLTWEVIENIRHMYETNKYSQKQISEIFNISTKHMSRIVNNETWKV